MKPRGNMDLWVALGIVLVLSGMIVTGKIWYSSRLDEAREEGRQEIRNTVLQERNDQLVAVQKEVARLTAEKEAREKAHATEVAKIDKDGQDALAKAEGKRSKFLDDLVAGRVRLPGVNWAAGTGGGLCGKGPLAGSAGVGDGEAAGNIPAGFGGFLVAQAKRADKVAVQLDACQKIIIDDRKGQ